MIYVILVVLGLCFGSFVNALTWRLRQQEQASTQSSKVREQYSILRGRSMCVHCHHILGFWDLVPVLSWLALRGKCRYCHKPVSFQYPLVEMVTAALFVGSYAFWPVTIAGVQVVVFGLWLAEVIGLMALLVYDIRWMLLPNRLVFPLSGIAVLQALLVIVTAPRPLHALLAYIGAVIVGGGIFYVLFQVSNGKWIGGGDVKLGVLLGLLVGSFEKGLLFIFLAAVLGTLASLPLLATGRLKRTSVIPFGPFLIVGGFIAVVFGDSIIHWYNHTFLYLS